MTAVRASDRLFLVVAPAAALASIDLIVKQAVPTAPWAFHHRGAAWLALSIVLVFGAFALSLVPSRAVALAGGLMSAGTIGNLVSARANGNRVPDPFTITRGGYGVAFNLADVFFLVGNVLLVAALTAAALRHRDRLERRR